MVKSLKICYNYRVGSAVQGATIGGYEVNTRGRFLLARKELYDNAKI